jgi:hypothetical protein
MLAQVMHALPANGPSGLPIWLEVIIYVAAAALLALGAWFVWAGRHADPDTARTSLDRWKQSLSLPTRSAVGLSVMLLAYHGAAWISPWQDRLLMVPREYWWIVAGGLPLVVLLALIADRLEARP